MNECICNAGTDSGGCETLQKADVSFLFKTLAEKDDALRYNAFMLLQSKSRESLLVYVH